MSQKTTNVEYEIYRKLVEQSGVCLFMTDASGVLIFLNQEWYNLTGFQTSDCLHQKIHRYISYLDRERFRKRYDDLAYLETEKVQFEIRFLHSKKQYCWFRISATAIVENGVFTGIAGSLENVDRFKEIEMEVNAIRNFYENILNYLPADIAVFSPQHTYLYLNQTAINSPSIREWLKGKDDFEYCRFFEKPTDRAENRRVAFLKAVETKIEQEIEEEYTLANGKKKTVIRRFKPIFDPSGVLEMVIGYGLDISLRKDAEISLELSLEKQIELNKLKSRFISLASHEFRTPLATIQNCIDLIRIRLMKAESDEKNATTARHLDIMEGQIDRINLLITNILTSDKIDSNLTRFNPTQFYLSNFIQSTIDQNFSALTEDRKVIFNQTGKETPFWGDSNLLTNILVNLISNALKYSENKDVLVNLINKPGKVLIQIVDKGIGIPQEDQAYLFSKFYRGKNTNTIPGTGLGLSIVKELTELHQGTISFQSKAGQGTTFTLELPRISPPTQ